MKTTWIITSTCFEWINSIHPWSRVGRRRKFSADVYNQCNSCLSTNQEELIELFPIAKSIFEEWNLHINDTKTEHVHFRIAEKHEKQPDGKPLRGDEEWCSTKLLGSLMCSTKDIIRRCTLGNAAFSSFKKVWLNSKITLEKKLRVYEAQVVSVLMYNSSCWAAPIVELQLVFVPP